MIDIDFKQLTKPNLWSYVVLAGHSVMIRKAEGEKDGVAEEKREILEYVIERTKLPNGEINQILEDVKQALIGCGYGVRSVKIEAASPALIGGSEDFGKVPFELGLCFDPILNVPYIPGSTIKGAVRAGVFDLLLERGASKEKAEVECKRLFGDDEGAGLVGFTDAYPVEKGKGGYLLYPDVMAPHYKSDTATELDVSPTPIIHLTIAPGTKFQFYLFFKRGSGKRRLEGSDLTETPVPDPGRLGLVDLGLLYSFYRGVGAKTSVGYSKFEVVSYEPVG